MSTTLRIATFNLENFDDKANQVPSLATRIAAMKPQLIRLRADILCLQEVNGQEQQGQPRQLLALNQLIAGTDYQAFNIETTRTVGDAQVYDERNLVVLSRFPIAEHQQIKHDIISKPAYKKVTANPPENNADDVTWERPLFYTRITLPDNIDLHLINLHLKSKIPSNIPGQKIDNYTWKTVPGWAEGYFLSSMKRVGQALETRSFIDQLFDQNPDAKIVVCGDFNSDCDAVPVETIKGAVEETGNGDLSSRVMLPCEQTVPEPSRFSLYHRGKGEMIDHLLISQSFLGYYRGTEIHNEMLHDESIAFATDKKFPESDHAPIVAEFVLPNP
jgi:predicted extracellular nuclease